MEKRITKTSVEMDKNLILGTCSEPDCGISIMVDKDLKEKGRKFRCNACIMRFKLIK